ncbi:coiled-coil domain-containing protein [Sphingomonas nostoxanthinifaciens]|uniref:hypothetical protein n=1 Tax=Sphingomonas nostoxanthinifaciens TaxID=2872652 RepID=UPI001CC20303|nr:hypothetical protein [Sphingomonas nostoxanthinifaciens]UAK24344.1 hypothetical protein K8P63_18860 [Sphingomonas nostoxanthinifaciens]
MATTDIIARLQLRADQFSSETGARFAELRTRAQSSAEEVRGSFNSAFADVQRSAQQALTLPRTDAGSLNLGSQIQELQRSADAADQNAISLRELAIAAERAAQAEGVDRQAMALRADAASVASLAAEKNASAIRDEIASLQLLQRELNVSSSATRASGDALEDEARHTGNSVVAKQLLQHSIRSAADSFAAGLPITMIFGEQLGRLGEAAGNVGGEKGTLKAIGAFMGGPWGIALTAGIAVLSPFVMKLFETSDAAGEAEKALDAFSKRQDDMGRYIDATTGKLIEQNRQLALIKSQTLPSEIAGQGATAQGYINQAFETARAKLASAGSSRAGPNDAQLSQIISAAGSNATSLLRGLQGSGRTDLSALTNEVAKYVGMAGEAVAAGRKLQGQQSELNSVLAGSTVINSRLIEQQVASANATTAVAKAQDNLNAIKQRGAEIDKMDAGPAKNQALAEYRSQLDGATKALDAAKTAEIAARDARKEHTKEINEALKAEKELQALLEGLVAKYDPATAAANRYAKELAEISRLADSGKLGKAPTIDLGHGTAVQGPTAEQLKLDYAAAQKLRDEQTKAAADAVPDEALATFKQIHQELNKGGQEAGENFGRAAKASFREIAETLESVLGLHIGSGASRVLSILGGTGTAGGKTDPFSQGLKDAFDPITKAFAGAASKIDGTFASGGGFERALGQITGGAALGGLGGGIFGALGGTNNKLASSIGGVLGDEAGKSLSKPLGSLFGDATKGLGKTISGLAGPLGGILGGVLGDVIGGLFTSPQKGGATITSATGKATTFGNNTADISAASGAATSAQQAVQQIAEQLGGVLGAWSPVTIGVYGKDNEYRVNTSGGTRLGGSSSAIPGVDYFGSGSEGEQAAIADVIRIEVEKGVITGISNASKNILASGQDLTAAINKALMIEAVPKDLKKMLDPVGAAIDDLNTSFGKTVAALKEGGATAEQMAQAQQLYNLELAQVKNSTDAADKTLQDFKKSLMLGSDSPYSLRDQETTARSALQPFLDQIAGGQSIDQSKYQDAAQAYLDVERQLYGSTKDYFDALDSIQAATNKAIETVDNATPIGGSVADPFASATADATASTATNTATANELLSQVSDTLANVQSLLGTIADNSNSTGSSAFIGTDRGYLAA